MKLKNKLVYYQNKWVAITDEDNEVIASDKDAKKLHEKLSKMKIEKRFTLTWVPPINVALVPNATI